MFHYCGGKKQKQKQKIGTPQKPHERGKEEGTRISFYCISLMLEMLDKTYIRPCYMRDALVSVT